MDTSSAWGAAPLFAAMFVLVVTIWAISLPAIRESKERAAVNWFLLSALLSAAATAIVGMEAVARQPETDPDTAGLTAQRVFGVIAVLGAFVAVGIGVPRALWKLSNPK